MRRNASQTLSHMQSDLQEYIDIYVIMRRNKTLCTLRTKGRPTQVVMIRNTRRMYSRDSSQTVRDETRSGVYGRLYSRRSPRGRLSCSSGCGQLCPSHSPSRKFSLLLGSFVLCFLFGRRGALCWVQGTNHVSFLSFAAGESLDWCVYSLSCMPP